MSPAENIIDKCGGEAVVARLAGCQVSAVYRWKYPKSRGGTGGRVPTKKQQRILDGAKAEGIALSPADFFSFDSDAELSHSAKSGAPLRSLHAERDAKIPRPARAVR